MRYVLKIYIDISTLNFLVDHIDIDKSVYRWQALVYRGEASFCTEFLKSKVTWDKELLSIIIIIIIIIFVLPN